MQSGLNPPSERLAREILELLTLPAESQKRAETRDRTGDLQIFSLTLPQLSYRGCWQACALMSYRRCNGNAATSPNSAAGN